MASNLSNTSFSNSFSNHSDFSFSTSTLAILNTGGIVSFVVHVGIFMYGKLNFNLADPFDGPLLYFLHTNVVGHFLLGILSIIGYFEKFWSCKAFSLLMLFMCFMGKYSFRNI